jgi:hypothetical protein
MTLSDDELGVGLYHEVHRQKVDTDVRTLVEQQAEALAGHALKLTLQHIEQSRQPRRESRRGHLAEAARAMGATPVTKE